MDELIFDKIRSISYNKYNGSEIRTFTFTVGQYLKSLDATITRIRFDELHFINTKVPRYVVFIQKEGEGFDEHWKGIPAYSALVEEDLCI